jgi:hypothetical protein
MAYCCTAPWHGCALTQTTHPQQNRKPRNNGIFCVLINSSNTTVVDYNNQSTIPPITKKSTIAATTTTATNNESESIKGVQEGGFKWLVQSLKLYKLELKRSWNFESLKVY